MGNVHARQYRKMPDVELCFFDRRPERASAFAERWSAKPVASVEEVIAQSDVVDVCLPTDMHYEAGMKAIAAGRPVFMEKPLAIDLKTACELVEAADKANVVLMAGQVVRYFPEFAAGHQVVTSGGIGTPAAARTRRGGPAPTGASDWFMDHRRSGGVLLDLAIHDFDWLRWTLGEVKHLYSRSVGASTGSGPDYALTTLTFENGCVAHVESTWMDPSGFRTTFEVAGSGGLIEFDSRSAPALRTNVADGTKAETPSAAEDDPYYGELRGFLDAVVNGTPAPVTGEDGLRALAISLAAIESAQTGRVSVPARQF
jgi:predicted dehydrogenase